MVSGFCRRKKQADKAWLLADRGNLKGRGIDEKKNINSDRSISYVVDNCVGVLVVR